MLIQAAAFQVWEFAIRQVFWTGGVGAMASASVFPIATFALYTRLALGKGPMVVHSLALSVLVHPIPTLLPLFGLQTLAAGLVDRFRVGIFPVITGKTGRMRIFDEYPDVALEMIASRTLDRRIQLLEYAPTVLTGPPKARSAG